MKCKKALMCANNIYICIVHVVFVENLEYQTTATWYSDFSWYMDECTIKWSLLEQCDMYVVYR